MILLTKPLYALLTYIISLVAFVVIGVLCIITIPFVFAYISFKANEIIPELGMSYDYK